MIASKWLKLSASTLVLSAFLHIVIVWSVPVAVMTIFMSRVEQQWGLNRIVAQALPTDTSRSIVKPSPDLLYGMCAYDVSGGPVRVSIRPPSSYWSLALFDRHTDNYFKLNAADLKADFGSIMLVGAADKAKAQRDFPSTIVVEAPQAKGVMLARFLVLDKANMAEALAAQASVRCDAVGTRK